MPMHKLTDDMSINLPDLTMSQAVDANRATCRGAAGELNSLASAFATTGNDKVANQLWSIAERLEEIAEIVSGRWCVEVSDQLRHTQRATFTLVEGILGGIELGRKGN